MMSEKPRGQTLTLLDLFLLELRHWNIELRHNYVIRYSSSFSPSHFANFLWCQESKGAEIEALSWDKILFPPFYFSLFLEIHWYKILIFFISLCQKTETLIETKYKISQKFAVGLIQRFYGNWFSFILKFRFFKFDI